MANRAPTLDIARTDPGERPPAKDEPRLLLIGVDYRTAPLDLREKVSYKGAELEHLLADLVTRPEIAEAYVLSTCNRTELYLHANDEGAYRVGLERALLSRAPEIETEGRFYVQRGALVARHLMEVSSGLQSMVLGEPEILGQIKQASSLASDLGVAGAVLQRLLQTSILAGGRVRAETAIGHGAVSFGYAVVDLARSIFQRLEDCSVLLIGAGEISRQVARSLHERGAGTLTVCNRSRERAEEFVEFFPGARILAFDELRRAAAQHDIVVASTGAETAVLTRDDLDAAQRRRGRPLLLVDLGVPRNIDPAVEEIESVFLQDIDSLEGLIQRNLKKRRAEVPRVQEILDRELELFLKWYKGQAAEPLVGRLHRQAEALRRKEFEAARKQFPEETHEALDRLTRSLVRKLLHNPSQRLRRWQPSADQLDLVRDLFQLEIEPEDS